MEQSQAPALGDVASDTNAEGISGDSDVEKKYRNFANNNGQAEEHDANSGSGNNGMAGEEGQAPHEAQGMGAGEEQERRRHRPRGGYSRKDRKKRRKMREINEKVEQALRGGGDGADPSSSISQSHAQSATSILPTDREKIWPGVLEHRNKNKRQHNNHDDAEKAGNALDGDSGSCSPTDVVIESDCWTRRDEIALLSQLGYVPGNVIRISARLSDIPLLASRIHPSKAKAKEEQEEKAGVHHDDRGRNRVENGNEVWQEDTDPNISDNDDVAHAPVAIELYPIVVRDEHLGNKRQGRKRKRHQRDITNNNNNINQNQNDATVLTTSNATNNNHDNNPIDDGNTPEEQQQQERMQEGGGGDKDKKIGNNLDSFVIEPFPTIYWLTHPLLRTLVSKLEVSGYGTALEKRLAKDQDALESMRKAHLGYGRTRHQLLTVNDQQLIRDRKWDAAFDPDRRGVAGIRNFSTIKCLHAHAAHYLSRRCGSTDEDGHPNSHRDATYADDNGGSYNVVGKWVMEEVEKLIQGQESEKD